MKKITIHGHTRDKTKQKKHTCLGNNMSGVHKTGEDGGLYCLQRPK